MAVAPVEAPLAPPSDRVILFALALEEPDAARDTIVALCHRYGQTPLLIDAAADPLFADQVRDPGTRAHFPLLCVQGTLVGGVEVLRALESNGKLEALLTVNGQLRVPAIALSLAAAQEVQQAMTGPEACLRIVVSPDFDHQVAIDEAKPDDLKFMLGDIACVLDPDSASRADGLAIDWVVSDDTKGFRIDNPNRPEPVHYVDSEWVSEYFGREQPWLLVDTRTKTEYEIAHLPGAVALDAQLIDKLEKLDPHTPLFFYCQNGVKSRLAAERYRENGFLTVYCLAGGLATLTGKAVPAFG